MEMFKLADYFDLVRQTDKLALALSEVSGTSANSSPPRRNHCNLPVILQAEAET